jgi:hypothetical protein
MSDAIRWYDQNVSEVSRRDESVAAAIVHGWQVDLLPKAPQLPPYLGRRDSRCTRILGNPAQERGII